MLSNEAKHTCQTGLVLVIINLAGKEGSLLYAGVSWNETGYVVAIVDDDGRPSRPMATYAAARTSQMIRDLRDLALRQPLVAVIESTCGLLDGRMMSAGLTVYRADPRQLPERPAFGSVPAGELASLAQRNLSALARLRSAGGTQTGRLDDLLAGRDASTVKLERMVRAGRALSHGDRHRPEVALTFDDGPNPPYTSRILDVLERYEVPATFFCVGMNVLAHPEEIVRIREQGHTLGNHTWSHPFLTDLSQAQLTEQIDRTGESIAMAGGSAPTVFRPPYGSLSPQVMDWLEGLPPAVTMWDVGTNDWAMPGAEVIAREVHDKTQPGSIILLHDGGGDRSQTAEALPAIIEGLLARGLTFTTPDRMLSGLVTSIANRLCV
jgi:peptidoglycan/xylan/chitin deacetylase (PgdA/CDA1 family)